MTFAAPAAAWLFALLIPLTVFYFLKLRRPRQEISSLTLWRQALNDQRVNSPFQRFKRNLLLLLQILLLAALAFAAMQPAWRRGPENARRLVALIDCSASMGALDKPGGVSRLEAAKRQARELIGNLLADQELCLISFARDAHKLTGFTGDKRLLRAALDAVEVEDVPGDIEDALRLAQALARAAPFDEALILSDGNFPARADFELSFKVNYQRLPAGGANLGIVTCNARRSAALNQWEIFLEVTGSAGAQEGASVELARDGAPIATERLNPSAPEGKPSGRLGFTVEGSQPTALRLRLLPDGFDSLAADNTVYLNLPALRPLNVYAAPTLPAWRHALQALDGLRLYPADASGPGVANPPPGYYDLAIADRPEDVPVQAGLVCTVGLIPEDLQKLLTKEETSSGVVDWRRDSPLLQHVELTDLLLAEQPVLREGASDGDFANLGYDILIQGNRGPLLAQRQTENRLEVCLFFHSDRSTLPYRVGFPIFAANLAQAAMKQGGLSEAEAGRTGALPAARLQPSTGYEVRGPGGIRQSMRSDGRGVLAGMLAPRAGEYLAMENGAEKTRWGASLLSVSETGLDAVETIRFNEQITATAAASELKTDRPLWFPLALAAFGLLLVEWWFFHRRPGLPRIRPVSS